MADEEISEQSEKGSVVVGLRLASSTSGEMIANSYSVETYNNSPALSAENVVAPFNSKFTPLSDNYDELVDIPLDGEVYDISKNIWHNVHQSPEKKPNNNCMAHGQTTTDSNILVCGTSSLLPTLDDGLSSSHCSDSEQSDTTEVFSDDQFDHDDAKHVSDGSRFSPDHNSDINFLSEVSATSATPDLTEKDIESFMQKTNVAGLLSSLIDSTIEPVWVKRLVIVYYNICVHS